MERERALELLQAVQRGELAPAEALESFARPPFVDTAHGRVDVQRALRQGIPEAIFAPGKTPAQIAEVVRALRAEDQPALATRVAPEVAREVQALVSGGEYVADARLLWFGPAEVNLRGKGSIAVVCAGMADLPVAREAAEVAQRLGNKVELLCDVGVAGLHRLLAAVPLLRQARVLIAAAGMEGALPSVVAGLVDKPVIAVPCSTGYGAALGGGAALLCMLTSCAPNVAVVNIDNGFGAAALASLINRL